MHGGLGQTNFYQAMTASAVPTSGPTTCFCRAWRVNTSISSQPTQSECYGIRISRDEKCLPDAEGFDLLRSLSQEAAQPQSVLREPSSTTNHHLLQTHSNLPSKLHFPSSHPYSTNNAIQVQGRAPLRCASHAVLACIELTWIVATPSQRNERLRPRGFARSILIVSQYVRSSGMIVAEVG